MEKYKKLNYLICFLVIANYVHISYSQSTEPNSQKSQSSMEGIEFQEYTIFDGKKGYLLDGVNYKLAVGASLVACANGDLLCYWMSGTDSEPATDNCTLMSRSSDRGVTWSDPVKINFPDSKINTFGKIRKLKDGRLIGFASYFDPEKHYTEWLHYTSESSDHGKTWSSLKPLKFPKNASIGKPLVLDNGEYLYAGTFFERREVPLKGPVSELIKCSTEIEASKVPPSISDKDVKPWKFGEYLHGIVVFKAKNGESLNLQNTGRIDNRPLGLLEPRGIELNDGSITLLLRAECAGFLWRSDSYDNGMTWTPAYQTSIPNPSALIDVIRLPDGRIALIHNPSGKVGQFSPRTPLSLWISNDEMKTSSFKADFFTSQDQFAYPNALIFQNKLVFAFDKNRREVKYSCRS